MLKNNFIVDLFRRIIGEKFKNIMEEEGFDEI